METILFLAIIALVAFLYASVGHGGASGYLALMAIWGTPIGEVRSTALVLNIIVSSIAFIHYYRAGFFRWNLFWPFVVLSVPMAFVGAMIPLEGSVYKVVLGVILALAVFRLFFISEKKETKELKILPAILFGGAIGMLSGMIGIGGGIILSPLIILLGWSNIKESSAISAPFILVNSISGLVALLYFSLKWNTDMSLWVLFGILGGYAGAYFGSNYFNVPVVRNILATVLSIAAVKLMLV
ncbi:MAG: sulfite exporter TauE/SafE family protein [Flavobacteriales bacterium]|nr:sulfite exporter TauE/SafE family protein [Flavobacteriales bacterium]